MTTWSEEDLQRIDRQYAQAGVAFHARPLRAAMDILGSQFVMGVGGNPEVEQIAEMYRRLFPQVDRIWPGLGIGLAASVDDVRRVTVAVVFGTCAVSVHEALGFNSHEEWARWCRNDRIVAACSSFAFADLYDLTYGIDEIDRNSPSAEYWKLALSNLEDVTNILATGFSVTSVIQPICLAAELAMKASLIHMGVDPAALARRDVGHKHEILAGRMTKLRPHRDDPFVRRIAAELPDYVQSRYQSAGLNRLSVVKLALGVQFMAASAVRRIGSRDVASAMEQDSWPGPRQLAFYV